MSTKINRLTELGQSIWYDYMERRLLETGELALMIDRGDVRGLTSNPSIFNHAIAQSKDYDSALIPMSWAGYDDRFILEQLMIEDIKRTADLLRLLFDETQGGDGYISLEVKPGLAYDTQKTIAEAQRLWDIVARPNVMIKIPATKPGLPAIRRSIANGININITLIFSIERYMEVMEAYLSGIEDRLNAGEPVDHINSVASFFVSRIDTKVDNYLEPIIQRGGADAQKARSLLGKIAIANARLAYKEFRKVFESERFTQLKARGARLQRPLWASTSTKNPAYPDVMYVDELIGAHTVNTVPPQTLEAFREHGKPELTIEKNLGQAKKDFSDLASIGISIQQVTQELEEEGVEAFSVAYNSLLASVKQRREEALLELGSLAKPVAARVAQLEAGDIAKRFYALDASLWTAEPKEQAEVHNRMGWLTLPETSKASLPELKKLVSQVQKDGYTQAVLLGMGGSSLAPEVMSRIFNTDKPGLELTILDSTDPAQVLRVARQNPVGKTLFIVSSKSGGTAEVTALFDYFWKRAEKSAGEKASEHFIAITDPGTALEKLAHQRKFRKVFLADPNVGGRYSALTAFGLVPAALCGIDVEQLLSCAAWMESEGGFDMPFGRNPGFILGTIIAVAASQKRDKLTFIADPELAPLGAWLEQLIAESSGKLGKGFVPVSGETPAKPNQYGNDRLFFYMRRNGRYDRKVKSLRQAGHPVLSQEISDNYALGSEFYKWEVAIALACSLIGVNAFDQPDVQDSKNRTVDKIAYYRSHQKYAEDNPFFTADGISFYGKIPSGKLSTSKIIDQFLSNAHAGDYFAINAYLDRDRKNISALQSVRNWVQEKYKLATTIGFGPRYLHSTGQLHKGGPNNGLFLIITADPKQDVDVPGEGIKFGVLEHGQALGDLEALAARGRRILHIHLDEPGQLEKLVRQVTT
jgi:transaldolase / glucose-6-phosphate isomerase